jgi:hypothetical protein
MKPAMQVPRAQYLMELRRYQYAIGRYVGRRKTYQWAPVERGLR